MASDRQVPKVGCGALIIKDGKILLVKRRRSPESGHWGLPGGKVEWLETIEAAVMREIKEELGVKIRCEELVCVVDQIDEISGDHWVAPVLTATIVEGQPSVQEPDALYSFDWFELDSLPSPATVATETALGQLGSV